MDRIEGIIVFVVIAVIAGGIVALVATAGPSRTPVARRRYDNATNTWVTYYSAPGSGSSDSGSGWSGGSGSNDCGPSNDSGSGGGWGGGDSGGGFSGGGDSGGGGSSC